MQNVSIGQLITDHGKEFGLDDDWGWSTVVPSCPGITMRADNHVFGVRCHKAEDLTKAELEGRRLAKAFLELVKKYGDHIAVGADVKDGEIATHGWTKKTGTSIHTFMRMMEDMGVATVICTDVSRDGALMGTNMELYRELSDKYGVGIIASGGITTTDEVFELARMRVFGAILGKAIYNGNIDLREAIKAEEI
jgi:uncharacterized protein related to proFAR isomerase